MPPLPLFHSAGVRASLVALIALFAPSLASAAIILDANDGIPIVDVLSIEGTYDEENLYLTTTFVPGTLFASPAGFAGIFSLDTDLDASTGAPCPGDFCGADWRITFSWSRFVGFPATAALRRSTDPATALATFPVTFCCDLVDPERSSIMQIVVPLDSDPLIGLPDDGETLFGLVIGESFNGTSFSVMDSVPDGNASAPLGGPTTLVPEPSTAGLAALGFVALGALRHRRRS